MIGVTIYEKAYGDIDPVKWNGPMKLHLLNTILEDRIVDRKMEILRKMKVYGFKKHTSDPDPGKEIIRKCILKEVNAHCILQTNYYHNFFLLEIDSENLYDHYIVEEEHYEDEYNEREDEYYQSDDETVSP